MHTTSISPARSAHACSPRASSGGSLSAPRPDPTSCRSTTPSDDDSVLVRTTAYSLLGTYGRDAQLCFEVDQFDHELKRGWSVVVRGRGAFVDDARGAAASITPVGSPAPGRRASATSSYASRGPR